MILCCGEALIDMLPRRTQAGEDAFVPHAGGAVFNTALALGRLGAPAGLWCGLSTDMFGMILQRKLAAAGVSTDLCPRSQRPTTLAFVALRDGQARYTFYDENSAARMVGPDDLPALSGEVDAMFFGGISLVSEPCGSAHEALMRREAGHRLTMLDPNIRPRFIADELAYRQRLARMIAATDVVKLSDEDLAWLYPDADAEQAVASLHADGPAIVLVTRGAEGAACHGPSGDIAMPAPAIDVVDTVGAGDAFNAGFLAGLAARDALSKPALRSLHEDALADCLSLAIRTASVTASRAGADPPRMDELPQIGRR